MRKTVICIICFIFCSLKTTADDSVLNQTIDVPKSKGTVYDLLNKISESSGMFFIYDGKAIDNNRKTKLEGGKTTIRQAILEVIQEPQIEMKVIGKHILLQKSLAPVAKMPGHSVDSLSPPIAYYTIEGEIKDTKTFEVLPFASVRMEENGMGTVANQNGHFLLKIPDSLVNNEITFSHIGYETQKIPSELLIGNYTGIYMNVQVVPIQEVIINLVNPIKVIKNMLDKRSENYMNDPVLLTTFYREGIEYRKKFVSLTEAVFKIYKFPFESTHTDRVKLLKMRKISEVYEDSIIIKFKAGVHASISLDIVKNLPDFLILDDENIYNYTKIDMTVIDSRLAHVIFFEQKPESKNPCYKGELYIDTETSALLGARFEINSEHIKQAKDNLVIKQSKDMVITPKEAIYTVSYKELNGKFYMNYIRGDLSLEVNKKKWIIPYSSTVHTYFEMVTCKIETDNIKPFSSKENLPTSKIFSETKFLYDSNFWKDFNIILPEQKLNDDIARISAQVEEKIETYQ